MADQSHTLELTYEQACALFLYNPKTGKLFWRERPRDMFSCDWSWKCWNSQHSGKRASSYRGNGYRLVNLSGRVFRAHRIIWLMQTGNWPVGHVDHINGVKKDNRWENLRDVPPSVNMKNRGLTKANTSGINGVRQVGKKWSAEIRVDGVTIPLGRFTALEAAIEARQAANQKYGFSDRHGT